MLRILRTAILLLAFALVSCAKSHPTAPGGGGADSRGTPLTGEMAFETSTRLTLSQITHEVLGSARAAGTLGGPGLAAVRTIDGAARLLETSPVLFPLVTPDGQSVYYDLVTPDSTILRRRSLGSTATARIAGAAGLAAFTFALSPDGRYVAFAGPGADPFDPDSIRVLDTTTGQRVTYAPAAPVVFSHDDGTLLVTPAGGGYAEMALASGTLTPVDFAIGSGSVGAIFFDTTPHALFAANDHELWESTIGGPQTQIFTAAETIVAPSITWSPDGARAAFWTIGTIDGGTDTAYRLYVVSLGGRSGGVVAQGRSVGGAITWSPDGTRLAYLFADRLFTVSVVAAGLATATR